MSAPSCAPACCAAPQTTLRGRKKAPRRLCASQDKHVEELLRPRCLRPGVGPTPELKESKLSGARGRVPPDDAWAPPDANRHGRRAPRGLTAARLPGTADGMLKAASRLLFFSAARFLPSVYLTACQISRVPSCAMRGFRRASRSGMHACRDDASGDYCLCERPLLYPQKHRNVRWPQLKVGC